MMSTYNIVEYMISCVKIFVTALQSLFVDADDVIWYPRYLPPLTSLETVREARPKE